MVGWKERQTCKKIAASANPAIRVSLEGQNPASLKPPLPQLISRTHSRVKDATSLRLRECCDSSCDAAAVHSNRFVFGVTQFFHIALRALRLARGADAASVPDQLVRKLDPLVLWNNGHQILLDFLGIVVASQIQPLREPHYMRIHHDPARDSIGRT